MYKALRVPKVSALILNFNGKHLLSNCLESLGKTTYPNLEIVVVDNGSKDGSLTFLAEQFPKVRVIAFEKNHGFCGAYNLASELVDSEFLIFLNNDVSIVNPGWLDNMVDTILRNPQFGVVGAKQLLLTQKNTIENVGGSLFKWQGGTRIGFGEIDSCQYDCIQFEPFYISGSALLINRNLFLQVGGFDPEMFAYAEDLDLCWRLRIMGYQMKTCSQAIVLHKSSASFRNSIESLYLSNRNFLRSSLKNYSGSRLMQNLPFLLTMSLLFGFFATASAKEGGFLLSIAKSLLHNLRNFRSTVRARQSVQSKRKLSDREVLRGHFVGEMENFPEIAQKLKAFV